MSNILNSLNPLRSQNAPLESIERILNAALHAADPYLAVQKNLVCNLPQLNIGNKAYSLYPDSRIFVVAIGKASLAMADAAVDRLSDQIECGLCVCKHNPSKRETIGRLEIVQGSHPVPDQKSVIAANRIKDMVVGLNERDVVVLLISGGSSALVCLPAHGIDLRDIQTVTAGLMTAGASINELNMVRKHLDNIKGGGLLKMAFPAQVAALVISDVVGSPLDVIASGPAFPDPTTFNDAIQILERFFVKETIPFPVLDRLKRGRKGEVEETLKLDDPMNQKAYHTIIASNQESAQKAFSIAQQSGFQSEMITCELTCEARLAGEYLADHISKLPEHNTPYVGIAGGETTVKVKGNGIGGRNLEVALGAVRKMNRLKNALLITLATDGEDGPTDAAGAFVTSETLNQACQQGLDPDSFLANNDAYNFFKEIGGLIITGPTGTNVNDLNFIFRY
ncbi:MAG: hydroxypyruvate reductase [Chloroflexi bacterium]|nr:MAG: hydroxypyruvate reductase [Chloroflexota bacterium]MBA4374651.1 glycerate kinase [Anaerolinea sp.]